MVTKNTPVCDFCAKPIAGDPVTYRDMSVHSECKKEMQARERKGMSVRERVTDWFGRKFFW